MRTLFCASSYVSMLRILRIGPVIDALFKFDIINTRICPNCGNKVGKVESNTSLHVQFEDGAPLEDILRSVTFGPSIYSDRRCEVCYTYMNTPNVPQLATGPDILVMQLARFTNWGESESGKNEAVIPFDEELDLSPYTHETFGLNYRLLSVVQHCGSRAHGHYITIAKGESGGWEKLDDTSASPADGIDPFCPKDEADFTPYILFWARVDEDVAAESPTDDETASTNDDGDGDDELQPLQISINGILQPPSEQYFVRMSLLVVLDQQRIEEISANIYTAWSEIEMGGREKNEEEEEEQDEDEDEGEEDDEDEKKEDEERKGKKNKEGDEEKKGGKITKKDLKKEEEKKKEQAKKELKELKTSIQKDSRKVNDETQKVQEKTKKGEKSIEEKKTDEEGEEDEEKEKRGISKKRKSSGHDSTSREESISVLKKQKSSNDNSPSQKKKRTKGGLKKK